jgi:hypothetical protein
MINYDNITFWSDQDGVIATYEPDAYEGEDENNLPFMQPGIHYFRNLIPDKKIINVYKNLHYKNNIPINVITNIINEPTLYDEHAHDKLLWTKKHMTFIDTDNHFFTIPVPNKKCDFVTKHLNRPLRKTDILISDYNKDLEPWHENGGTAIKYGNGLNDTWSWHGDKLSPFSTSYEMYDQIIKIINHLLKKE